MKIFGCKAWAKCHVGKKQNPRAEECIFLRVEKDVSEFRLWNLIKTRIEVSRDEVFNENVFPGNQKTKQ